MNILTAVSEVAENNQSWVTQLLPFSGLIGVFIGALLTGVTTFLIAIYNNRNSSKREKDTHKRNTTEEHKRWLRNEKVRVYNDYLNSAERIKQVNFTKVTGEKDQLELLEDFGVITNPTLLPISSRTVVIASKKVTAVFQDYLVKLSKSHPDGELFGGRYTPEVKEAFETYHDAVHRVSNAMRADLGIEPLYKTQETKEA